MKKVKRLLAIVLMLTTFIFSMPLSASAAWNYNQGSWSWVENGQTAAGWRFIDQKWYFFDGNGHMATGWRFVDGNWYYMDASGAMATGWRFVDGNWYYMDASGAMATGWRFVDGNWYYMDASGAMLTGFFDAGGETYFAAPSGEMQTGVVEIDGDVYLFGDITDGSMKTGLQEIDDRYYYFREDGTALGQKPQAERAFCQTEDNVIEEVAPAVQPEYTAPETGSTSGGDSSEEEEPQADVLNLYVAPDGSDAADGLSQETALQTITGANALLTANPFDGDVIIHFAAGEYPVNSNLYWRYSAPGRKISFEGAGQDQTIFIGEEGNDRTFLTVSSCQDTSFSFRNFTVQNLRNGIIMRVSNDGSAITNDDVTGYFENLTFRELGGYYTRNPSPGVAAIQLLGSCNNTVENCSFIKLRDYVSANIHGLYISTFSSNNVVRNCHFEDILPDPVRLRRGSSNNLIENCTFVNSGTYAYCSEWSAGPSEPEECVGVVFRGNEMFSGYAGASIPAIMIFKPGTAESAGPDAERLTEYDNILHESTYDPEVDASAKNYTAVVDSNELGTVPVYSIDRYEGCLNLDDIAYLLKGTDYAFTYSIESTEGSETEKMILIQLDESYSGTGLSVQEDADEGDITADQLPGWFIQYGDQGNGSIPVFSKEESYFVSLDAVSQLMGFEIEFVGDQLNIVTIPDEVEVPEEIQVLQMKFPGSFANLGENAGNYALTDPSNYDVITMQTAELADIIDFEKLIRSGMQYVIVAIPVGTGTYGIREWKNPDVKDYYTFTDRKWSTSSGGYADSFHTGDDEFIYYAIIPVGGAKPSNYPQFRVAPNWTSGGIPSYTQFFITDIENYELP